MAPCGNEHTKSALPGLGWVLFSNPLEYRSSKKLSVKKNSSGTE